MRCKTINQLRDELNSMTKDQLINYALRSRLYIELLEQNKLPLDDIQRLKEKGVFETIIYNDYFKEGYKNESI
jgi:hypothetical protein